MKQPRLNNRESEAVHAIWDELSDFDAARSERALHFLMHSLCDLIQARRACWFAGVRLKANGQRRDPVYGWRPLGLSFLDEQPIDRKIYKEAMQQVETGIVDECTIKHFQQAGRFRAVLLKDHVSPAYYDSDGFHLHFGARDMTDVLFVIAPVNRDAESFFTFMRMDGQKPFTSRERDLAAYVLRPIRWFHRQLLLSHGLLVANQPVTRAERRVLNQLLTDKSEKQIAETLNLTPMTTHTYIREIYRKFGVHGRAGLTALWLGRQ